MTTFDVDTLTFIEPEIVEPEEVESGAEQFEDVEPTEEIVEVDSVVVNTIQPVDNSGTPIEIVRNDIDESSTEQLNLF